ncbi:hypothetical protein DFA_06673 [Cavenderia fasciculata]|uniref:Uncharacterized protein n=1 Tax=Cavenderia fasciculata TaxID=261658 RepID=F4Q1Y7_CACFS|nr:uncharacterized protein DFA_06673 [Cavenderia fasciculata]EGG18007.1 hypothetical protein DFA_06673 [Cavenderia fasciculata]|eukprot:XP_004356900.1 hypothetical protein DFA_06673 [Cavenderia fasciculata]
MLYKSLSNIGTINKSNGKSIQQQLNNNMNNNVYNQTNNGSSTLNLNQTSMFSRPYYCAW